MAHYALLDNENIVVSVFVGRDETDLVDGIESWETYYSNVHGMACLRTSYNTRAGKHVSGGTPFRLNYAAVGYRYDPDLDGFIEPQPWPSWTFNDMTGTWTSPTPRPHVEGEHYVWDENVFDWVLAYSTPVPHPNDGGLYDWDETTNSWRPVD